MEEIMEMGSIIKEDITSVASAEFIPWEKLKGKTILITGATGLIGTSFIRALDFADKEKKLNVKIIALVRDGKKAAERFADIISGGKLHFVVGNVENPPVIWESIDYIVHGAGQTASTEFVRHAVETIQTTVLGTLRLLELARENGVDGFVFLSSMEVYGYPEKGHKVAESEIGRLTPQELRNSYPISKLTAEAMCVAYAKEYGVPAMVCRLTQTFGPGVSESDSRIFAYFGRCVREKKNIVLKTKGETERSYIYTTDAVTALLTILLKGKAGSVYNAADENTYCSIAQMAERVAADGGIQVEYDIQDEKDNGFPETLYIDLDTTELKKLGWNIQGGGYSIVEMFRRMIEER